MAYKRKIVLINPQFQIRLSLVICSIVFISSLIYPLAIYGVFEEFFQRIPQAKELLGELREPLLTILITYEFFFIVGVFVFIIFVSHKIAGPLYKLKMFLASIADGNRPELLRFRKGDYFKELETEYNRAIESIRKNYSADSNEIDQVIQYIQKIESELPDNKKSANQEVISKLKEIKNRYVQEQ